MPANDDELVVHVLWINAGLSCDGDSVSLTAATLPSVEDIALGALPGLPKMQFHWPLVDYQVGKDVVVLAGRRRQTGAIRPRHRGLGRQ